MLLTYPNDDGSTTTIAYDELITCKTKKIKGKIFFKCLYTLVVVRYGEWMVIKEDLTYSELKKYEKKLKFYQ